jgi:molecular chaperone GrpE (heat shock protein)
MHEALMHTPSDVPEGHIVQVVQRGYQLRDKVIRHTKVITSAGLLPEHD